MSNLLVLHEVYKSYGEKERQIRVLQGLSMGIQSGTRIVLTGESGSGKTTLLSVVSGLDTIDAGSITIGDTIISDINEESKARFRLSNIGFVFQYHYLLQDFSALGNIMLPLLMLGTPKSEAKDMAFSMLEKVGLTNRQKHVPSQLSGGECQRVAIARALVHNPLLILADEPTGALDTHNSEIIRDILCHLVQEQRTTLLIATHDRDFLSIADIHWNFQVDGTIEKVDT